MRILLLGKDGQLGRELRRRLAARHTVVAWGRVDSDLSDIDRLRTLLDDLSGFSLIINAAAYTSVDRAEQDREHARAVNGSAPGVLARYAERCRIPLIHFSTDYVFDGRISRPYVESDFPNPLSVYGESKLAGEIQVQKNCERHLIFRLSALYGLHGHNFFSHMTSALIAGRQLRVVDDQTISPNWNPGIAAAVENIVRMLSDRGAVPWGVYHLSGTGSTTWYQFVRKIHANLTEHGLDTPPPQPTTTQEFGAAAGRPAFSVLDSSKFAAAFHEKIPDWTISFSRCLEEWNSSRDNGFRKGAGHADG